MVTLEERVEIAAPFEKLLFWLDRFEEEYRFSEFTPAERTNVFCVCELFNPPLN